jgi:hypothetical protein
MKFSPDFDEFIIISLWDFHFSLNLFDECISFIFQLSANSLKLFKVIEFFASQQFPDWGLFWKEFDNLDDFLWVFFEIVCTKWFQNCFLPISILRERETLFGFLQRISQKREDLIMASFDIPYVFGMTWICYSQVEIIKRNCFLC